MEVYFLQFSPYVTSAVSLLHSLLSHYSLQITSWLFLFFSNSRSSILCANVIICLLYLSVVQNRYITYQVMIIIPLILHQGSFTLQMSAAPYQAVCCCYDFYCLLFTAFKQGTTYKIQLSCRHLRFGRVYPCARVLT